MVDRNGFAELMKALREKAGMTQAALAERSGLGVSTIRQFEYGLRKPSYKTLIKLAAALDVSLSAFDGRGGLGATMPSADSPPIKPPKSTAAKGKKGKKS